MHENRFVLELQSVISWLYTRASKYNVSAYANCFEWEGVIRNQLYPSW